MQEHTSSDSHQSVSAGAQRTKLPAAKVIPVALLVVGLGAGFIGGMSYQKHHQSSTTSSSANQMGTAGGFGGRGGGGFRNSLRAVGTVTAVDSSSISIQERRTGTTTAYTISSSTTVTNNGQSASVSDIKVGDTVVLTKASSTSQAATQINLNPSFGGAGAAPSSSTGTSPSAD